MLIEVTDPCDSGMIVGRLYRVTKLWSYKGDDPGADNGSCRWVNYKRVGEPGCGTLNLGWHELELMPTEFELAEQEYNEIIQMQETVHENT